MAEIEFDPEDYIDEISTRHLIRELKKRKILPQNFDEFQSRIEPDPFLKTPKRAMIIDDGNVSIPDECKANAKLIAAAPELLNQLLKSRELLVQNGFHTWSYVIIDIDSAIKKATK